MFRAQATPDWFGCAWIVRKLRDGGPHIAAGLRIPLQRDVAPRFEAENRAAMEDIAELIRRVAADGFRTLVTTLTKRMAEELAKYLVDEVQ